MQYNGLLYINVTLPEKPILLRFTANTVKYNGMRNNAARETVNWGNKTELSRRQLLRVKKSQVNAWKYTQWVNFQTP